MSRKKGSSNWKVENIKAEASKFSKRKDFMQKSLFAYRAALKRGIIEEVCAHMEPNIYNPPWTKEGLKQEALKYKTRNEFKKKHEGAYATARKLKIMEEICSHMAPPQRAFTEEEILEEAKKFTTRRRFKLGSKMYKAASRKGRDFLDKACSHMKKSKGTSIEEERILSFVRQYFPNACKKRFKNLDRSKYSQSYFELDVYIPELNKGIEYDGSYWHRPDIIAKHKKITLEEAEKYHDNKDGFFASLGIQVLHIHESHWESTGKSWDERKILSFLGLAKMPPSHKYFRYIWSQNPGPDGEF